MKGVKIRAMRDLGGSTVVVVLAKFLEGVVLLWPGILLVVEVSAEEYYSGGVGKEECFFESFGPEPGIQECFTALYSRTSHLIQSRVLFGTISSTAQYILIPMGQFVCRPVGNPLPLSPVYLRGWIGGELVWTFLYTILG